MGAASADGLRPLETSGTSLGVTVNLLYHDVVDVRGREAVGFSGPLAARYKLDPALFSAHLDAVAASGMTVGLVDDLVRPAVTFTFDDGGASSLVIAAALEGRAWRGHFFVPTAYVGRSGFLERTEILELLARGHVVGSHSHAHPTYMGRLARHALDDEWRRSREILGDILGSPPATASVPGGFVSQDVIESAAECGYELLMTSAPTTRLRQFGGLTVLGRYAIWADTPADHAAAYARRDRRIRTRLWLEWHAKDAAKRASPRVYQQARRLRARI
jgi:peptidoglycan/xylan/chitin deacetylase (PgdA/CDA1 family)